MTRTSAEDRFWSQVRESGSGCWEWTGYVNRTGYGNFHLVRGESPVPAHRFAYEAMVARVPEGLVIDHLCRNRACVNPAHLDPVPQRVNVLRGTSCMATNAAKTHCPQGHEHTPENTMRPKSQPHSRFCLTCNRERNRRYRARGKGELL